MGVRPGSDIRVTVVQDSGDNWVDIRSYVNNKPTLAGVVLDMENFSQLYEFAHSQSLKDLILQVCIGIPGFRFKKHIGNGIYISASSPFALIHIRKHFIVPNSLNIMPTKRGIAMHMSTIEDLPRVLTLLRRAHVQLTQYRRHDHENQEDCVACSTCNWEFIQREITSDQALED